MKVSTALLSLCAIALVFSTPAHAYLDPGTGSILLQGLIAGVAGGLTIASMYYHRFKSWLLKTLGKNTDTKK
jgi:uncharacterized membrane-anchored protein